MERRLAGAVAHSDSVRELAGNPLLLTVLAIIGRRQSLPRDRKVVYAHAVTVLVAHWDQDVKFLPDQAAPEAQAALDMSDRLELLQLVARRMQHGAYDIAGNHIHGNDLEEIFRTYLEESLELRRVQATATARALIKQLRERNFILSLYGDEVYGFVHRAFLEYLAAMDITHRYKEDRVWTPEGLVTEVFGAHAEDPTWHEVLLLVTGQLGTSDAARVVDHLLSLHRGGPASSPRGISMLVLAIRALAEVRKVGRLHEQSVAVARSMVFLLGAYPRDREVRRLLKGALPALSTFNEHWVGRAPSSAGSVDVGLWDSSAPWLRRSPATWPQALICPACSPSSRPIRVATRWRRSLSDGPATPARSTSYAPSPRCPKVRRDKSATGAARQPRSWSNTGPSTPTRARSENDRTAAARRKTPASLRKDCFPNSSRLPRTRCVLRSLRLWRPRTPACGVRYWNLWVSGFGSTPRLSLSSGTTRRRMRTTGSASKL